MAKNIYVGVGSKARKVKALYVGVGGKARKVKKVYVGVGGKARLVYQSYIPVTGISISWELSKKQSYEKYPVSAMFTVTVTPSNATNPTLTWTAEDGLSVRNGYYDYSGGLRPGTGDYPWITYPSNQRLVHADTVSNGVGSPGKPLLLTVSADGVSKSVRIYSYYHSDKDGDKTNGITKIELV